MADNVTLPGTGAVVGADEVSIGGVVQQVQRVKLVDGTDGGTELLPGSAARGLSVDPRPKAVRKTATPTISTTAYASGDAVGGLLTFSGAARAAGGSILVQSGVITDADSEQASLDLFLFDRAITAPTDNAAFDPTDAELAYLVGVVSFTTGDYRTFFDNAAAFRNAIGLEAVLNGADLYGVLVTRSTPTYTATSDLSVVLTILQD